MYPVLHFFVKCDNCQSEAITFIRYSGAHLCGDHLSAYVLTRVKKALREQVELTGTTRIMFAVSGGKDSLTVMHTVHKILSVRRDVEFMAVTIDEGIDGYRPSSVKISQKVCDDLGIPLIIRSFEKDLGGSLDVMSKRMDKNPCTICGVLRRKLMNETARENNADYLITGLNLDDTAQTVLMNLTRGDVSRLFRMAPHKSRLKDLVPRAQPLIKIPEKEAYLYALVNALPIHGQECPYAVSAERLRFRDALEVLENGTPGSRHGILRSLETIKELREFVPRELPRCKECGEPSSSEVCSACNILALL